MAKYTHNFLFLLLKSWPLWAIEASDDPSPLFSVCCQPHHFWQWTTTPVHNIIHPPSGWSASMSVPIHHAQHVFINTTLEFLKCWILNPLSTIKNYSVTIVFFNRTWASCCLYDSNGNEKLHRHDSCIWITWQQTYLDI